MTLTVTQAADLSGRDRHTIYRLIKAGELEATWELSFPGRGRYRIDRASFDVLMARTNGRRYILPRPRKSS